MSQSMLSARTPYNAAVEFYRRPQRGLPMSLGQNSPLVDHYETSSHLSRRTSPSSETEIKNVPAPRKRVTVACDRCRKRKIKCSGDDEGRGCSNCRNAGYGACRFMRVQSLDPELFGGVRATIQNRAAWHGSTQRYQPYPISVPHRYNYDPSPTIYGHHGQILYPSLQSGLDSNPYGATSQNGSWARLSPYSASYPSYEDESSDTYAAPPPSFILPNTDPMANPSACLSGSYPGRSQAHTLWLDQSASISQAAPSSAQIMASAFPLSTDNSQGYQTMNNANVINLSSERILPTPTSRHYNPAPMTILDNLPISTLTHRSSNAWQSDGSSSGSQVSSQTSCSSVISTGNDSSHDRAGMACSAQEANFGYLGIANSPQPTVSSNELSAGVNDVQTQATTLISTGNEQQHCRTISRESLRESPITASSSYGYTSTIAARDLRGRSTSGQLSNGIPHTRAEASLIQKESKADDYDPDCSSRQSETNRASTAAINNMSSY